MPAALSSLTPPGIDAPSGSSAAASHRITDLGDRVIVHDLEVFMAFDPEVDDPQDERIASITEERIDQILATTQRYIARGTNPRLIRGHNSADPERDPHAPSVGVFSNLRKGYTAARVAVILADCEMSRADFEADVASNRYPRRSAEIWPDGFLSEVALLGARTPARPLRDTHFGRAEVELVSPTPIRTAEPVLRFSRQGPRFTYEDPTMPKDTNTADAKPELFMDEDEMKKLRAENESLKEELKKYKAKHQGDDDDKEKHQALQDLKDRFDREKLELTTRIDELEKDREADLAARHEAEQTAAKQRWERKIGEMASAGFIIPEEIRAGLVEDFMAEGGEKRFERFQATCTRGAVTREPLVQTRYQTTGQEPDADQAKDAEKIKAARDAWSKYAYERQDQKLPVEKTWRDFLETDKATDAA